MIQGAGRSDVSTPSRADQAASAAPVLGSNATDGCWSSGAGPAITSAGPNAVGVITVNWQQIVLGKAAASRDVDVWVTDEVVQVYDGDQLLRTQLRRGSGQVRKKRASVPGGRSTVKSSVTHHPE